MIGSNNAQGVNVVDFANLKLKVPDIKTVIENAQEIATETNDVLTKISNQISIMPTQSGTLTYTGSAQSPTWNNYDSSIMTIGGTTSATNAGNYVATFTPVDEYYWSDGTQSTIEVTWSIGNAVISTVPSQSGTLTYTGSTLTPTWNNYDATKMTIGGVISANDIGSYIATFTPLANYQWSDGSTSAKNVTWKISRILITTVPSQSDTLTYTGSTLTPTWDNYDDTQLTIGGTTSATNAGTYTATFTPKDRYAWSDGTTTAKSVTWTIAKATGTLTLSSKSVSIIGVVDSTTTVTATRSGDGTISVSSSNTSVATVSVSGTTVMIKSVATGTATITVSVAAGTNYTAPASQTVSVTITIVSSILNDNDWSIISEISNAGTASTFWSVGDRKAVTLSGTVINLTLNDVYYCYILGFDHNSSLEGSNRIHFQFGYSDLSGGAHIAFADENYLSNLYGGFIMNETKTCEGGWSSSYMRSTICPAFKAILPTELQNVLKTVTKYTDNNGTVTDSSSSISATTDDIFLLAVYEAFGEYDTSNTSGRGNIYEQYYQTQYDYYSAGNSTVAYRHDDTSNSISFWLRSPQSVSTSNFYSGMFFCAIKDTVSNSSTCIAKYSSGFAPCFCV